MGRRRKPLSPEDRDLWNHVARQVQPMHPRRAAPAAAPQQAPTPPDAPPPPEPLAAFTIGARAGSTAPDRACPAGHPVRMDRKAFTRLKGGKLSPEARIDLHGMTLAQAHPALIRFILNNQARGRRLVLVITGKGRDTVDDGPIPQSRGVLKRQVPHWLHQPPLSAIVLQITSAHHRHGGEGALYVYLRRLR